MTVLTLKVANAADPDTRKAVDFLIDSGAVYSFVPRDVLAALGIAPHSRQRFQLANGSTIERDRADALFFYKGRRGAAPVIFGEPGDAVLLGAVTLESLGYVLDAVKRDLVALPMVIAGFGPLAAWRHSGGKPPHSEGLTRSASGSASWRRAGSPNRSRPARCIAARGG